MSSHLGLYLHLIANVIFYLSLKHFLIVIKSSGFGGRCSWNSIPLVPFTSYEISGNFFKCSRPQLPHGKVADDYIFFRGFGKEYL